MLPAILFLCQSATLFIAPGAPLCRADSDHGALYYSICGTNFIGRSDGATAFTAAGLLGDWDVAGGVIAASVSAGLTIVTPDGMRRELVSENVVLQPRIFDGYVYWLSSGAVRRVAIAGGAVETVADGVANDPRFRYAVFGDQLLFIGATGLWVKPLTGGAPALLLPRSDVQSVAGVTSEGITVTTSGRGFTSPYAQLLRVPWIGAPVETIYQAVGPGFQSAVAFTAAVAGDTTYVAQSMATGSASNTALIVLRDGAAQYRYRTSSGPLTIIDAGEEAVIVVETGRFERICAVAPRGRAVSR